MYFLLNMGMSFQPAMLVKPGGLVFHSVDGCRAGDPYSLSHSRFDAKHGIEGVATGPGWRFPIKKIPFSGDDFVRPK